MDEEWENNKPTRVAVTNNKSEDRNVDIRVAGVVKNFSIKGGETLVIGGLKNSARNVSEDRVPFLGKISLIGLLFKNKDVTEEQRSLSLFISVEIVE